MESSYSTSSEEIGSLRIGYKDSKSGFIKRSYRMWQAFPKVYIINGLFHEVAGTYHPG